MSPAWTQKEAVVWLKNVKWWCMTNLRSTRLILAASVIALSIASAILVRFVDVGRRADSGDSSGASERGESVIAKHQPDTSASINQPAKVPAPIQAPDEPKLEGLAQTPPWPWLQAERMPGANESRQPTAVEEEVLPWDLVEPVPLSPDGPKAAVDADGGSPSSIAPGTKLTSTTPVPSPSTAAIERWIRASVSEIKGEDRSRAIYHFDFWLEAPEDVRQQLASVAYEFSTPAVMPQSQISLDSKSGFRVSAGGLTCPDEVAVTLKFNNDQSQRITVDGCQLVNPIKKPQTQH